jgi:lipopolysaccharide/colanic/teichoic acid biosynthesis glycosyltransferase
MYSLTPDGGAETAGAQFAVKDDKRVTRVGKFLRKTRLDEIPQFINLLKGDITLIGPRPERPQIVEQLESAIIFYSLRHIVKPGLTGWAVVHQNYTDTMEKTLQKLQYDLYYIKNQSVFLDISILLKTINLVIRMMGQ